MNDSKQQLSDSEQSETSPSPDKKTDKKQIKKTKNKIVINVSDCQYPVVSKVAKHFGWKKQNTAQTMDWDICWTDNAVQPQTLSKMQLHQKINHFPGMYNLARKNLLGRALMRMRKKFGEEYDFFPLTWMLPVQYHELKAYFESKAKGKARTFIVKPQCMSQGKGIFLTRKLQDINSNAHCVVQRYLHRPYLIDGLKFDLRVYVLIASVDPLTIYLYEQGLGRFATQKYEAPTKQNMQDVCMHLTNYAINKDNPKFVFNQSQKDMSIGHKRSLTSVFDLLKEKGVNVQQLKSKMKDCIIKTMISGLPHLTSTYRSCQPENYSANMCFQLLGFDVMLNQKAEPIILEINHTPSFTTDTPLDHHIKFNYIRDALTLMNISEKNKNDIIRQQKQACQQRVMTGKKIKLTGQQKQFKKKEAIEKKLKYQSKHMGKFQRIYPLDLQNDPYRKYIQFVDQVFQTSTGAKKVIKKQKQQIKNNQIPKSKIKRPTLSTTPDLLLRKPIIERKYESKQSINITQNQSKNEQEMSSKSGLNIGSNSDFDRYVHEQSSKKQKVQKQFYRQKQTSIQQKTVYEFQTTKTNKQIYQPKTPKQIYKKNQKDQFKLMMNNFTRGQKIEKILQKQQKETKSTKYIEGFKDEQLFRRFSRQKQKNSNKGGKQKIPIVLNTLLINGMDQQNNFVTNNFKKFMIGKPN